MIARAAPTILVDNGAYRMDNMGDVAMLQVCVARLHARWPGARIRVLVETPDRLAASIPGVEPLAPGRWHAVPAIPHRLRFRGSDRLERRAQLALPTLAWMGRRRSARFDPELRAGIDRFHAAVRDADMAVCSGGGFLNDWYLEHGDKVLHTLGLAQAYGKPTAMFGAGLGPLHDAAVGALARAVLSRLAVLALREERGNRTELASLGVRDSHVLVTGDDAVEPAYEARPGTLGDGIGVCVRLAASAGAPRDRFGTIGATLHRVADELQAPLRVAPVRTVLSPDDDVSAARAMLGDVDAGFADADAVATPADLIRLVGRCRVMVTGAYHAGVFALAQGIPVVALTGTSYYDRKFGGLLEQFGDGVTLVPYEAPDLPGRLEAAVREAWHGASRLREPLLRAAAAQVARGVDAYDRFCARAGRPRGVRGDVPA